MSVLKYVCHLWSLELIHLSLGIHFGFVTSHTRPITADGAISGILFSHYSVVQFPTITQHLKRFLACKLFEPIATCDLSLKFPFNINLHYQENV